ncbi:hypothetical protein AKJ13_00475 [Methylobacterium sp. ARG-1]|nr:hypothetical protein AKJ13_00475 [Methylobacterium sp. ARG-1]
MNGRERLSLRLLSIFSALMGGATTKEAAEGLGISQPAVSNGIKQLETMLGVNLFERLHRRLEPTEEAFQLYAEIQPVFSIVRGFEARAKAMRLGVSGRLRILSTPPLGHSVAAKALSAFLQSRPDVTVSYDVRRLESVVDAVHNGTVDVGLGLGFDAHQTLNIEVLAWVDLVCLVPADHPLAEAEAISVQDLKDHDHIGLDAESPLGNTIRTIFIRERVDYAPRVEVRYCATAAVLSEAVGVATIVDPFTALGIPPSQVARPLIPACTIPVALMYRAGVPRPALVSAYVNEVRKMLRGMGRDPLDMSG